MFAELSGEVSTDGARSVAVLTPQSKSEGKVDYFMRNVMSEEVIPTEEGEWD